MVLKNLPVGIKIAVHHLWCLVLLFAKGLNYMPGGLKVSWLLIANMIPFVNTSNFFKWKNIYNKD